MKFKNLNTQEALSQMMNGISFTVIESKYFPKGYAENPIHLVLIDFENVGHHILIMLCERPDISKKWIVKDLEAAKRLLSSGSLQDLYWPLYHSDAISNLQVFDMIEGYRYVNYLLKNQIQFEGRMELGSNTSTPVVHEVIEERIRQDEKWGEQNHAIIEWMSILMEEVGEASKEAVNFHFSNHLNNDLTENERLLSQSSLLNSCRTELIQVAAVAVAMVESIDRNGK